MRQRLVRLLGSDERDPFADSALRLFWSLTNAAAGAVQTTALNQRESARVVDLSQWTRSRGKGLRT
jgi:hypothetical protein